MKTCKFYYSVFDFKDQLLGDFPTLAMARNFCTFNKGHYKILCSGFLEYKEGVEIK